MPHFPEPFSQPDNSTIIIPEGLLPVDYEIAAMDAQSNIVGRVVSDGTQQAMAVAAYSSMDDMGIQVGSAIQLILWDNDAQEESWIDFTFEPCDGGDPLCADDPDSFELNKVYTLQAYSPMDTPDVTITDHDLQQLNRVRVSWVVSHEPDQATYYLYRRVVGDDTWGDPIDQVDGIESSIARRYVIIDDQAPSGDIEYAVGRGDGLDVVKVLSSITLPQTMGEATVGMPRLVEVSVNEIQQVSIQVFNASNQQVQIPFEGQMDPENSPYFIDVDEEALGAGEYTIEIDGDTFHRTLDLTI